MSTSKKVSIIIVNYNSTDHCINLLKSIKKISKIVGEILIIDNNSNSVNKAKLFGIDNAIIIKNNNNLGFSKAVNQGIDRAKYPYILLLNPDCLIIDDSPIKTFQKIVNNKHIGIIGGKITDPKNNLIHPTATMKPNFFTGLFEFTNLKKLFPKNKFSKLFWVELYKTINKPIKVFSICGAYMFVRNFNIKLNEKYFLYLEDLDLGNTIEKSNLEVWFDPESHVSHIGGESSNSKYKIVLSHWYNSRNIYFVDNLPIIQGYFLYIIFFIEETLLNIYHFVTRSPNE